MNWQTLLTNPYRRIAELEAAWQDDEDMLETYAEIVNELRSEIKKESYEIIRLRTELANYKRLLQERN